MRSLPVLFRGGLLGGDAVKVRRMSVTLPEELAVRLDEKAKKEGITRQQLLAALVDLGIKGSLSAAQENKDVIGPLAAVRILRHVQGTNDNFARGYLRDRIWDHLTALMQGARL